MTKMVYSRNTMREMMTKMVYSRNMMRDDD